MFFQPMRELEFLGTYPQVPKMQIQGVQTLSDKSNFDTMVCKIGQISKVKLFS